MAASSRCSPCGWRRISRRSISSSRSSNSLWAFIDTYSPAAIEKAPAIHPASPASRTYCGPLDAAAPATPRMRETLLTSPSLMPNTAARAVPPWMSRWWCSDPNSDGCWSEIDRMRQSYLHPPPTLVFVPGLFDATRDEIAALLADEPPYRVDQVWQGRYHRL